MYAVGMQYRRGGLTCSTTTSPLTEARAEFEAAAKIHPHHGRKRPFFSPVQTLAIGNRNFCVSGLLAKTKNRRSAPGANVDACHREVFGHLSRSQNSEVNAVVIPTTIPASPY